MTVQQCKNCQYLDVPPTASGVRRVMSDGYYRCLAPVPDLRTILPESVIRAYGWRQPSGGDRVNPAHGAICPAFVAIPKRVKP